MAEYGTKEYFEKRLKEYELDKQIYLHALDNIARRDFPNYELIDIVANKIADINASISFTQQSLLDLEKGDSANGN